MLYSIPTIRRSLSEEVRSQECSDENHTECSGMALLPIAVADIYGGYYLGGLADPMSLKFAVVDWLTISSSK